MDTSSCCFSGHREIAEKDQAHLSAALDTEIALLAERGITNFYCGGALGFDTMAARAVIRAREANPRLRLLLAIPYEGVELRRSQRDRAAFEEIMEAANETFFVSPHYDRGCMLRRDRFMVDRSSVCVCYLTQSTGGTAYTVGYALSKELEIINLAMKLKFVCI